MKKRLNPSVKQNKQAVKPQSRSILINLPGGAVKVMVLK